MISGHKHVLRVCGLKMIWSQLKHAECCGETNEGWPGGMATTILYVQ